MFFCVGNEYTDAVGWIAAGGKAVCAFLAIYVGLVARYCRDNKIWERSESVEIRERAKEYVDTILEGGVCKAFQGVHCFSLFTYQDILRLAKSGLPVCCHRIPAGCLYCVFAGSIHFFFNLDEGGPSLSYAYDTIFSRVFEPPVGLYSDRMELMKKSLTVEDEALRDFDVSGVPEVTLPAQSVLSELPVGQPCPSCGQLMLSAADKRLTSLRDVVSLCDVSVPVVYVDCRSQVLASTLSCVAKPGQNSGPAWRFYPELAKTAMGVIGITSKLAELPYFSAAYPPRLKCFLSTAQVEVPWDTLSDHLLRSTESLKHWIADLKIKNEKKSKSGLRQRLKELESDLDFHNKVSALLRRHDSEITVCWFWKGPLPPRRRKSWRQRKLVMRLGELCCDEVTLTLACLRNTVPAAHLDTWDTQFWHAVHP